MTETTEPPRGEQVDDVLAAIRRLVSAEEQERRRAAPKRNEGSLILTNEMRIDVQDGAATATMTERRPTERKQTERKQTERRQTERRATERNAAEPSQAERNPTESRPTERRPTERRPSTGGLKTSIDSPVERSAAPAPSERRRMGVPGCADERLDRTPALAGDDLAELVRSIVREELQGELGERISTNIRKLVRREIGRAIAARMGGG
ncbi:MAG: hypothetical protein AAFR46_17565 [Pseudomonadota bacterium]